MGQVVFDETDKPLMRMTYQGLCDDAEWQRHIDQMSEWARRGDRYAVVIDARSARVARTKPGEAYAADGLVVDILRPGNGFTLAPPR